MWLGCIEHLWVLRTFNFIVWQHGLWTSMNLNWFSQGEFSRLAHRGEEEVNLKKRNKIRGGGCHEEWRWQCHEHHYHHHHENTGEEGARGGEERKGRTLGADQVRIMIVMMEMIMMMKIRIMMMMRRMTSRIRRWECSWSPNPTDFYFWYSFVDQHRNTNMNDKDHHRYGSCRNANPFEASLIHLCKLTLIKYVDDLVWKMYNVGSRLGTINKSNVNKVASISWL